MLDIAFSELIVIGVVALVVIGPEKLPKVAKTAGILLGRAQRYVNDIKTDLNRQIQFEELKALQAQMAEQARDLENTVKKQMLETEAALTQSAASLKSTVEEAGKEIDGAGKRLAAEVETSVQAAGESAEAVEAVVPTESVAESPAQLASVEDELYRGEPAYIPPRPSA
ncbi:Sec-independent protein translocase protein TatB (modular protein) [Sterolibacterium denitrificans]|uniref:Sec-independent protein translocase protein TatB n=1 Tax=Sterolibacterium denitrificans TaxID=157592 RepID=A0A7Z7HQI2_9PROT|nr:Sec-independent protein translocase protein TatB [Sterolibacterium denitrificans]SMB21204.1 Sec-independent protein translocase protein TatB (modular protein) [Sterolibacterium denitrificans]